MSNIQIYANDQKLVVTSNPVIASQGVEESKVVFTLSDEWTGYGVVAVFFREDDEEHMYTVVLDGDGGAFIPWEVTTEDGVICIGLCGSLETSRKTSNLVKYKIEAGVYTDGEQTVTPTPGVYEQMLAIAGEIQQNYTNLSRSLNGKISTETAARIAGDGDLDGQIAAERARIDAIVAAGNVGTTETVLYTGEAYGTGTTYTLAESIANYAYLDVYISQWGNLHNIETIPAENNVLYILTVTNIQDSTSGHTTPAEDFAEFAVRFSGTTMTINNHSLTMNRNNGNNVTYMQGSQAGVTVKDTAGGYISKVVGRKMVGNAEVEDIRTGYDGTVYGSAGTAVRSQVSDLADAIEETREMIDDPYVFKFSNFEDSKQVKTYNVGQTLTIDNDSTGKRAVSMTPVFFTRKTRIIPPTGYEFFWAKVTSDTNFKVLANSSSYTSYVWVDANTYIMFQVRRTDQVALTSSDMAIINAWLRIDYTTCNEQELVNLDVDAISSTGNYGEDNGYVTYGNSTTSYVLQPFESKNAIWIEFESTAYFRDIVTDATGLITHNTGFSKSFKGFVPAGVHHIQAGGGASGYPFSTWLKILSGNYLDLIVGMIEDQGVDVKNCDTIMHMFASKKHFYDGTGTSGGNNHDNFTVLHLTDIHADAARYKNFIRFKSRYSDLIDCAICTGDFVDNQNDDQWAAMTSVGDFTILQVAGNHDAGHQGSDTLLTDEQLVAKFGITTNTGKMYYTVDYDDITLIALNQFEGNTRGTFEMNQTEMDWFIGQLDAAITASKPVIVAMHIPDTFPASNNNGFYQRYNRFYPYYPTFNGRIEDVIAAFKAGSNVSFTLSNGITVNHTFSAAGDFICYICGHYHGDFIGYSASHSDQLYLMGNCGVCQPKPFKSTFMGETNSDLSRIPDTASEDCFNVYSFDLVNREVKVVRIGSCINDQMAERKGMVLTF